MKKLVDESDCYKMSRLDFEYRSTKSNVYLMLLKHISDSNDTYLYSEEFERLENRMVEKSIRYFRGRRAIKKKYVNSDILDTVTWNLSYYDFVLSIDKPEFKFNIIQVHNIDAAISEKKLRDQAYIQATSEIIEFIATYYKNYKGTYELETSSLWNHYVELFNTTKAENNKNTNSLMAQFHSKPGEEKALCLLDNAVVVYTKEKTDSCAKEDDAGSIPLTVKKSRPFQDIISEMYPELHGERNENGHKILTRSITFQVTEECNLACKYCYQFSKTKKQMKFEYAKKTIDLLLTGEKGMSEYINPEISPAIVLDFIGGEPFLQVELIEKIVDYFKERTIEMNHPWSELFMISICSNGILYKEKKVQAFLNKYRNNMSFAVTIDGNKELHDSCRVFPDGSPSYEIAVSAAKDWISKGFTMGSKITIAPENIQYLDKAIAHMIDLGYDEIYSNCVFEEGWTLEHAKIFYTKLKIIADYFLTNNLEEKIYCSLFEEKNFVPQNTDDNDNWCGGTGDMLALSCDGKFSPCQRYLPISQGGDKNALYIGDVETGIGQNECTHNCITCLNSVTRTSQSSKECIECPISTGCAWCSAYNYQVFGTANKRATFICEMHKARALANVYFWNQVYKKHQSNESLAMHCPKEWAIPIIGEEEYNYLLNLSGGEKNAK